MCTVEEAIEYTEENYPNETQDVKNEITTAYMDGYLKCIIKMREDLEGELK